jgi:DNA sulfur modification protein DndE
MESTSTENSCRAMKYDLLIDEAHVIFKERKYQDILEKYCVKSAQKVFLLWLLLQGYRSTNF